MVDIARVSSATGRTLSPLAPLESHGGFMPEADIARLPPMLLRGLNIEPALRLHAAKTGGTASSNDGAHAISPKSRRPRLALPKDCKDLPSPVAHVAISLRANCADHPAVWRLVVQAPIQHGQHVSGLPVARRRFRWNGHKQRTGRSLPQHQTEGRIALGAVHQGRVRARRPYLCQQAINRLKGQCPCLRAAAPPAWRSDYYGHRGRSPPEQGGNRADRAPRCQPAGDLLALSQAQHPRRAYWYGLH